MSIAATWIWAPALFYLGRKVYVNGTPGLFWFLVPNILLPAPVHSFGRKIREQMPQGLTLSGYMADKYHSALSMVYTCLNCRPWPFFRLVQLLAGAKILAAVSRSGC